MYEYFFLAALALGIGQLYDTYKLDGGYIMLFIPVPGVVVYSVFFLCCMIIDLFEFEEYFFHRLMPSFTGSFAMALAVVFIIVALPAVPFFFYCVNFYCRTMLTNDFQNSIALRAELVGGMDAGTVAQWLFYTSIVGYVMQIFHKLLKFSFPSTSAREPLEWDSAFVSIE